MARKGDKNENVTILKEIYDDNSPAEANKKETFENKIKSYFQNDRKIDQILSVAILGFGLAAVVLGFFQFRGNINQYFVDDEQDTELISLEEEQDDNQDLLGLRARDTDIDGISDYDEINIYGTSPYLEDTDSDGISDRDEISRQTDPNCPEGRDCFLGADNTFQATPDDILLNNQFGFQGLRQSLLEAGVDQDVLDGLSDDELLATYQQLLVQADIESSSGSGTITTTKAPEELTANELRELLRVAGVAEQTLQLISDDELLQLVQDINPGAISE